MVAKRKDRRLIVLDVRWVALGEICGKLNWKQYGVPRSSLWSFSFIYLLGVQCAVYKDNKIRHRNKEANSWRS